MIRRYLWGAALAGFVIIPFIAPSFWLTLLDIAGISALIGLGLVLLTGAAGLTSFGQAAFAGIAAYVSAYLTTLSGFSPLAALPFALLAVALAALLLGGVTLRLSGHYLPISTIAWAAAIFYLFAAAGSGRADRVGRDPADQPRRIPVFDRPQLFRADLGLRSGGDRDAEIPAARPGEIAVSRVRRHGPSIA